MIQYEIIAPKGERILTVEDWLQYAPPKSCSHWRDGRSAKELAKYILLGNGIDDILSELRISCDSKLICYPEHVTPLPQVGNGRNHDLMIVSEDKRLLITLEAKADEELGSYIKNIKDEGGRIKRVSELKELVFMDTDYDASDLRYQLLTATAGTIIEAQKHHSTHVYFVLLSIKKKGFEYKDSKIKRNATDFLQFQKKISQKNQKIELYQMQVEV